MHIQKTLEQFGLRSNEVRVYLAALNLGDATISDIAEQVKLPRTSVQILVRNLTKNGLINFFIKRKRKHWIAENPEKLLVRLREKEAALKEIMPQLQALRHDTGVKPTVKFYNGIDGVKQVLEDIIETRRHILSLTSMEDVMMLMSDDFKDFVEQRYKHHLRVRFLTNRSPETKEMRKRDSEELRHTRFLPSNFELKNANFIYGDKVAIVSLNKKMPVGIIIEDQDIAKTQAGLFEAVWACGSE